MTQAVRAEQAVESDGRFHHDGGMKAFAILTAAALSGTTPPTTILFVGNSFTFGALSDVMTYRKESVQDLNGDGVGGVPALFKRFADEARLRYEVSLETAPGRTLSWHLANKSAAIARRWDAVVLQPYSTLSPDKPGDPGDSISAARGLAKLVRARNPRADISLVATWSRPDLTYPNGKPWSGMPIERMALDLRKADDEVRRAVGSIARVVPVGEAFNCAIQKVLPTPILMTESRRVRSICGRATITMARTLAIIWRR